MSIKSHLLAGLLGSVVGVVGGLGIGKLKQRFAEKKLRRQLGGITQKEADPIINAYDNVINGLVSDLNQSKSGLGDELKEIFQLCLPQENSKAYSIPKFRAVTKNQAGKSGIIEESFRLFDAYYSEKDNQTDKYVAMVQVLDNLHYVIYHTMEALAKDPTKENLTALAKLREAIKNLDENVQVNGSLGKERDHKFIMAWKTLKRKVLIDKLIPTLDDIYKQAAVKIKQANLQKNCQSSINNMQETGRAMSEFFLKTLDKDCGDFDGQFTRKQMADQRLHWNVKSAKMNSDKKMKGPVADLIGKHMRNSLKFDTESVDDKQHYFNKRFTRGDFQVEPPRYTTSELQDWTIPKFMQKQVKLITFDEQKKLFLLNTINSALNNINIAIALEEDLKHKINLVGSRGIVATGEFEMRRAMIEAYYEQAAEDFKTAFGEEYYQKLMTAHMKDLGQGLTGVNLGIGRDDLKKQMASHELQQVVGKKSIFETSLTDALTQVGKHQIETKKAQQGIQEYVDDENELLGIKSFELDSNQFLFNMAYLAAQDKNIAKKMEIKFSQVISSLKKSPVEQSKFIRRVKFYDNTLYKLDKLYRSRKKAIMNGKYNKGQFSSNSFELYFSNPMKKEQIIKHKGKIVDNGDDVFSQLHTVLGEGRDNQWLQVFSDNIGDHYLINYAKLSNLNDVKEMRNYMAKLAVAIQQMQKQVSNNDDLEMALIKQFGYANEVKILLEDILIANGINDFNVKDVTNQQYKYQAQQLNQTVFDMRNEVKTVKEKSMLQTQMYQVQLKEKDLHMEEMQYQLSQELQSTKQTVDFVSKELKISTQKNVELNDLVSLQKNKILKLKDKISTFVQKSNSANKEIIQNLSKLQLRITNLSDSVNNKLLEVSKLFDTKKNANISSLKEGLIELEKVRTELNETLAELSKQVDTILLQAHNNKELIDGVDNDVAEEVQELINNITKQQNVLKEQRQSLDKASTAVDSLKDKIKSLEKIIKSKNKKIDFLQTKNKYRRGTDFTRSFVELDKKTKKENTHWYSSHRKPKAKFLAQFMTDLIGSAIDKENIAGLQQAINQSEMVKISRHGVKARSSFFAKEQSDENKTLGERMMAVIRDKSQSTDTDYNNKLYTELLSQKGFVYRDYTLKLQVPSENGYRGSTYAIELYNGNEKVETYQGDTKQPYLFDQYLAQKKGQSVGHIATV